MESNLTAPLKRVCLSSMITFGALVGSASADEPLKGKGESWNYLFARSATAPIDPAGLDPTSDFDITWYLGAADFAIDYDGPDFLSGNAPLGYGEVPTGTFPTTNVWNLLDDESAPPEPRLNALYLRTTLNPTRPVGLLKFTGKVDDGAIVYVNGDPFPVARVRVPDSAMSTWDLQATDQGNEGNGIDEEPGDLGVTVFQTGFLGLPANQPIDIAISLHNSGPNASDLFWDVAIEAVDAILPQNDDFEDAIVLPELLNTTSVNLPIKADTSDGDFGPGATLQNNEPNHNGDMNSGGSIWYRYEASGFDRRIWVSLAGSNFDTLLAVYTGDTVGNLTEVKRFPNWSGSPGASSSRDSERFGDGARVEFDAISGETYYIAVDGANGDFGQVELRYGNSFVGKGPDNPDLDPTKNAVFEGMDPIAELVPPGANWGFLLYTNSTNDQPASPALEDADFYGINGNPGWQTASTYGGDGFNALASAPLGYGNIDALKIGGSGGSITDTSNIWGERDLNSSPPEGERYTAYFRHTFTTPNREINDIAVYGLIDDGAVIYINGEEEARINIAADADVNNWQLLAESVKPKNRSTEAHSQAAVIRGLSLPANQPVEIAVSLHNADSTSSDLALDLQVFEQAAQVVNPPMTGPRPVIAVSPAAGNRQYNFSWGWQTGETFQVQFSPVLENPNWTPVAGANVTENNGNYSATVTLPASGTGFYRVELQLQ